MKPADYMIECERRAYFATKNPLHAWAAYGVARQHRRAIPEWVLEYLDKSRLGLVFSVPDQIEKTGTGRDLGPTIARAFGLAGRGRRGTPFESYYDTGWSDYGRAVRDYVKAGHSREDARAFAAVDFDVHETTIIRGEEIYDLAFPEGDEEIFIDVDDMPDFETPDIEGDADPEQE